MVAKSSQQTLPPTTPRWRTSSCTLFLRGNYCKTFHCSCHNMTSGVARYVRIVVQTWNGHISMRAAVLLCSGGCATDATDKTTFRQRLCVGKVQGHHFKRRANNKPATADALSGCQIKPCPPKCKKAIKKTTEAGEPTTPYTTVVCAPSAECLAAWNKCIQSIQQAQSALNTKLSSALKDYTQQRQAIARG